MLGALYDHILSHNIVHIQFLPFWKSTETNFCRFMENLIFLPPENDRKFGNSWPTRDTAGYFADRKASWGILDIRRSCHPTQCLHRRTKNAW